MGACVPPTVMTAANVAMERRRFPRCTNGAGAPSPIDPQVPSPSPRLARIQRFRRRGERARRAVRDAHLAARPPVWRAFAARARPFQSRRSPDRFAPLPPLPPPAARADRSNRAWLRIEDRRRFMRSEPTAATLHADHAPDEAPPCGGASAGQSTKKGTPPRARSIPPSTRVRLRGPGARPARARRKSRAQRAGWGDVAGRACMPSSMHGARAPKRFRCARVGRARFITGSTPRHAVISSGL